MRAPPTEHGRKCAMGMARLGMAITIAKVASSAKRREERIGPPELQLVCRRAGDVDHVRGEGLERRAGPDGRTLRVAWARRPTRRPQHQVRRALSSAETTERPEPPLRAGPAARPAQSLARPVSSPGAAVPSAGARTSKDAKTRRPASTRSAAATAVLYTYTQSVAGTDERAASGKPGRRPPHTRCPRAGITA